ncbi:MAG TPA: M3 family oligoendopeptidase [Bacillales bacterium]|nr:M3 family oligoendopeptidase [Bacillales bacterium]
MKFSEYTYERPDIQAIEKHFNALLDEFQSAASVEDQNAVMEKINGLRSEYESMAEIAEIRHTIDTTDERYKEEQDYFDETRPVYTGLVTKFYQALVHSEFRAELEEKWGKQLFQIAELTLKTFEPEIVEDLQTENKLATKYMKLIASAQVEFEGEKRNLSQLGPFQLSTDRSMRKRAAEARFGFLEEHEGKLDDIYDQLVKVRTKMARKLGYDNFVEMGYARMNRTDYNAEMVANFREQVKDYIVPVAAKLKEKQRERIGVEGLKYYDDMFEFKTGNAKPKGDAEWILENARRMYAEMSPETDEFFTFMTENGLMDLVAKKGKASGGYCTFIDQYKAPFIFSNFNGTSGDVDVLTHEGGHAFQIYSSRQYEVPEYQVPTMESAEIHSMSMEFFAWPWAESFFKEDTEKYKFSHLGSALLFIPYGVAVDEFQHFVYENPDVTPAERKSAWREIEKKYLPYMDYGENEYLERGGFWQKQSHIYGAPFYYIDYTLAQVCAFQFWKKVQEDRDAAWKDYDRLCRKGGSQSFTSLVEVAGLISPFEDGCVQSVIGDIESYLDSVEDTEL